MFGFLKNLIGERGERPAPEPVSPSAPAPGETNPPPAAPPAPAPTQSPVAAAPAPAASSPSKSGSISVKTSGRILLSLKAITEQFPPSLKATLMAAPDASTQISLKLDDILPQLPSGRVEVPLRDLRQAAPLGTFVADTSRDGEKVSIPLSELLPKIDSSLFKPKGQQRVEVPKDIDTPFRQQRSAATTRIITPSETEVQAAAATPAAAPAPAPVEPDRQIAPGIQASSEIQALFAKKASEPAAPQVPTPAIPLPVAASAPAAPLKPEPLERPEEPTQALAPIKLSLSPSASQSLDTPSQPTFGVAPAARRQPLVDASAPTPNPTAKTVKLTPEATPEPPVQPVSLFPSTPAPAATEAPRATPSSPTTAGGETIAIPLAAVSANWPEAIREEITGATAEATIEFPKADLEVALKQGKVALQWARLRRWVRPSLRRGEGSMYDDALVELPLSVVAPLFMAASRPAATGKRITVDESMPALFQPNRPAAPVEPPAISASSPQPPASRPLGPAPATTGAGAEALGTDGRVPSVLVERACSLRGVAGAVVALGDGLLVSASVPEEFTAETIAAFLPQVFSRLEQAAGSMKIGEVQHLSFAAGDRTWQIWRAGDLFFAAIGNPNEMLPAAQLKIIATQLARQTRG